MKSLTDRPQRLMALLHGGRVERPPFWEVWFRMDALLAGQYRGDWLAMADDLQLAAVPMPGVGTGAWFTAKIEKITETGVWYGGGALRGSSQLHNRPEPDWDRQIEQMLPLRRRCADAGLACWAVLPWCFHSVATSMGLENLALAVYDEPEFVHEAMDWCERRNLTAVRRVLAEVRPDFVLFDGDCAYKTGPMVAPDMLRDFCFEPTVRTITALREHEIPVAFHTDGKLDDVMPMLIDLGVAMVHGCEAQANDLAHLVQTFGDQIALCGNMDVVFLKNATVEQVRQATRAMLRTGSSQHRFAAACNTSPLDYIPVANYRAMAEEIAGFHPDARAGCL